MAESLVTPASTAQAPQFSPFYPPTPDPFANQRGIYFINRDGSGLSQLVDATVYQAEVSPDGSEVLYWRSSRGLQYGQVLTVNIESRAMRALTPVIPEGVGGAHWSFTGRYVVFSKLGIFSAPGITSGPAIVWIVNRDGSNLRQLSSPSETWYSWIANWLHDDSGFFVVSDRLHSESSKPYETLEHVFLVSPSGNVQGPIAEFRLAPKGNVFPIVSPDGSRFLYVDGISVSIANVDGSNFRHVTEGTEFETLRSWLEASRSPLLAPDGTSIVPPIACHLPIADLAIRDVNGSTTNLTRGRIGGEWFLQSAQWTPDGGAIVFIAGRASACP